MQSSLTLINIYEQDTLKVGVRAVDLASIARAHHGVPLTFVIPCEVFEEFMSQTGVQAQLAPIYSKHPPTAEGYAKAYKEITSLFKTVNFTGQLREDLLESYASLSVKEDSSAQQLVGGETPRVNLLASPTYQQQTESIEGLVQNIKGEERFLAAIKDVWLSLFVPAAVMQRTYQNIRSFSTGIIVQRQVFGLTAHGVFDSAAHHPITIRAYRGLIDTNGTIIKDDYHINAEHLKIVRSEIRQQPYKLVPENDLVQEYLQDRSVEPALDEKQVLEAARLTKRVHILLSEDIELTMAIKDDVKILYCMRRKTPRSKTIIIDEQQSLEELGEFDPDREDLGLEQKEAVVLSEGDTSPPVAPAETPITEELVDEIEAFDHPVEEYEAQTVKAEEYYDPVPDPAQEETLFDIVQHQTSAQDFVITTANLIEQILSEQFIGHFGRRALTGEELVNGLSQTGLHSFRKEDVIRLFAARDQSRKSEPSDEVIGLAWRLEHAHLQ